MPITTYTLELLGLALAVATLPLVVELALLTGAFFLPARDRFTRDRPRRERAAAKPPAALRLGVIIPAHNEERLIASCVESLLAAAAGTETRIAAIAHNCTDQTAIRAAKAGAEVLVYDDPAARGKGFALLHGFNYMLAQKMDAVLVVDADSTVSANLLGLVGEALADGAEAVQCRYELESVAERPRSRLAALAFRGFNLVRARGRERLGLSAGILGNGFAVRQSVLRQQPYRALSVVEDLEYHLQLVRLGKKVKFLESATVSSGSPGSPAGDLTQRSRWEGGRARVARMCLLPLLRELLRGQLRLIEPILDLGSLPIGYAAILLALGLCMPLEWLRIYAALGIAAIAAHVLAAAWAGEDFAGDLRILFRAPGYILWKVLILPRLVRGSRGDAAWVRTEREQASKAA